MKKWILFLFIGIGILACKKEAAPDDSLDNVAIEKKNTALFMDITATWCNQCGSQGQPAFKDLLRSLGSSAVVFSSYGFLSDLSCPSSIDFQDYYKPTTLPGFIVNSENVGKNMYIQEAKQKVVQAVNNFAKAPVIANTGLKMVVNANSATIGITSVTQFFTAPGAGNYTLALYVVEDGVVNKQYTDEGEYDNSFVHERVLRHAEGGTWGEPITSAGIEVNKNYQILKTIKLDSGWKMDKLNVIAVIWQNEGNKHTFVNAAMAKK